MNKKLQQDIKANIILDNIYLTHVNFEENANFKMSGNAALDCKIDFITRFNKEKTQLVFQEKVHLLFPEIQGPFQLQVAMAGVFHVDDAKYAAQLENFANVGAPAILFPHLREVVDTLTGKSKFPRLVLPLVNFQAIAEKKAKKGNKHKTSKKKS